MHFFTRVRALSITKHHEMGYSIYTPFVGLSLMRKCLPSLLLLSGGFVVCGI